MKLAKRTAAVLLIAWLRGAYGFIEPPTSSLMHLAERMCSFFKLMANIRVRVSRGSYGGNTPMPIYVYSNSPSAEKLKKKLPRDASWENLCRVSESVSATGFRNKLTVSQAYPDRPWRNSHIKACPIAQCPSMDLTPLHDEAEAWI